jgi:hypothetical protein
MYLDFDFVLVAPVDLCTCPAAGDVWFVLEQQPLLWTYSYGALQFWVLSSCILGWCRHLVSWGGVVILYLGLDSSFGGGPWGAVGLLGLLLSRRVGHLCQFNWEM